MGDVTDEPFGWDPEELERAWEEAIDLWGINVRLSPPTTLASLRDEASSPNREPLAFIDLEERQVVVNVQHLVRIGATDSLPAIFAHEVGHHVEFPRTLQLLAELEVLERRLLPDYPDSLVNLFLDLQVNEVVGRKWPDQVCSVYRGSRQNSAGPPGPIYAFYLAVYEELWDRTAGSLVGGEGVGRMDDEFPGWRAEARMFAQTFWGLPETHLQFVYFCSMFERYLWDLDEAEARDRPEVPMGSDAPEPTADDYSGAIRSSAAGNLGEAVEEGKERGWIDDGDEAGGQQDVFDLIGELANTGPGKQEMEFRRAVSAREYARLVDRHLFDLPGGEEGRDVPASVPATVEPWEHGENPSRIDWIESVLQKGPLAGAEPLRFDYQPPDDPGPEPGATDLEIYLDTSGSMPDPVQGFNAMTLAAQILSAAAIRGEGRVRAAVYSSGSPMLSEWMYDERTARRYLLHYSGGGTTFPFDVLRRWSNERRDAVRVVITDRDFLDNAENHNGSTSVLAQAAERSNPFVAMLGGIHSTPEDGYEHLPTAHEDFRVVEVGNVAELGAAASRLADALFDER